MKTLKMLLIIIAFFLTSYGAFAQSTNGDLVKQAIIFGKEDEFRAFKSQGIDYDKAANQVRVCLLEENYASKLKSKGIFVAGTSSTIYDRILLFNFSPELVFKGVTGDAYSAAGGNLDNWNRETMSTTQLATKPFAEVKQNYASFFAKPANPTVVTSLPYTFGMANQTKIFDESINEYVVKSETETVVLSKKKPIENIMPSQIYCIDNASRTVTTYFGKKGDEKYSNQKYLVFATYDQTGAMLDTFSVNFPFPRNFKASFNLRSKSNPNETVGKVFFFDRMTMFGKKYNDPDKNNYEIVVCDNHGKLLLYKTIKIGDPDKSLYCPLYAVMDNGKIWTVGNYANNATYGLLVKTFDKDGTETTKEIAKDDVWAKCVYDKNVSKRGSGAFDKVGFNFSLFDKFMDMGHVLAPNGDLLFYGRIAKEVDDPNYKPEPGQMASMMKPQVNQYKDFVAFQFSNSSDLTALYGAMLSDSYEPGTLDVTTVNDKVLFSLATAKRGLSELEGQMFKIKSLTSAATWEYPYKQVFTPKFIVITPASNKIDSQSPTDASFALFMPEKYYVVVPNLNKLYYYGFAIDKKKKDQLNLLIDEIKF